MGNPNSSLARARVTRCSVRMGGPKRNALVVTEGAQLIDFDAMTKRRRNFWVALGVLLGAPSAFAAVLYVYSFFAPDTAKLRVFTKLDKLQIPSAYSEYLHAVDAMPRKALVEIADAAAPALKNTRSFEVERDLAAMRSFAEASPIIFRYNDPRVITVKIENVSRKTANNVKVFFSSEGFVQIAKDDAPVDAGQRKGWVQLGVLEPSSQFLVTMWTPAGYASVDNIRVNSDREGAADVREWYVPRDKKRWVLGFDLSDAVFFLFMGFWIIWSIFGIILIVWARFQKSDTA